MGDGHGRKADGSIIVGYSGISFGWHCAFMMGPGGMQCLGVLPGGTGSRACAVSSDGSVVVGSGSGGGFNERAFRWTGAGGMEDLGTIGGDGDSNALDASGDGSIVVGYSGTSLSNHWHAFRWTRGGGMRDLGLIPGANQTAAYGVSGDGSVIVGTSLTTGGIWYHAIYWTSALGMVDLNTYLPSLGVNLSGWTLREANGISANGSVIVGTGIFNGALRAWMITGLPTACYPDCTEDGSLTVADFGCFQTKFVAGDPYADCNDDGTLTVADFGCFQTKFVAGCP